MSEEQFDQSAVNAENEESKSYWELIFSREFDINMDLEGVDKQAFDKLMDLAYEQAKINSLLKTEGVTPETADQKGLGKFVDDRKATAEVMRLIIQKVPEQYRKGTQDAVEKYGCQKGKNILEDLNFDNYRKYRQEVEKRNHAMDAKEEQIIDKEVAKRLKKEKEEADIIHEEEAQRSEEADARKKKQQTTIDSPSEKLKDEIGKIDEVNVKQNNFEELIQSNNQDINNNISLNDPNSQNLGGNDDINGNDDLGFDDREM